MEHWQQMLTMKHGYFEVGEVKAQSQQREFKENSLYLTLMRDHQTSKKRSALGLEVIPGSLKQRACEKVSFKTKDLARKGKDFQKPDALEYNITNYDANSITLNITLVNDKPLDDESVTEALLSKIPRTITLERNGKSGETHVETKYRIFPYAAYTPDIANTYGFCSENEILDLQVKRHFNSRGYEGLQSLLEFILGPFYSRSDSNAVDDKKFIAKFLEASRNGSRCTTETVLKHFQKLKKLNPGNNSEADLRKTGGGSDSHCDEKSDAENCIHSDASAI